MELKQLTKEEIDSYFNSSHKKLQTDLEYFEEVFEKDENYLRIIKEMKRDLKSLKFFRNNK